MRAAILAAVLPEARAIARAFHLPSASCRFTERFIGDERLIVGLVGAGARHLHELAAQRPGALIMAGLAGALASDLAIGDVVIQGTCADLPGVRFGTLARAGEIVATPAHKAALFRQTGALAVDMETAPARQFAQTLGIPFLAVRAISDTAADTLDPALLTLLDGDGRPRVGRVLAHLARGPGRVGELLRLRRATHTALARLAATLVAVMESGWPEPPPAQGRVSA
jgi:adenosylhomocysteine nucleosidase